MMGMLFYNGLSEELKALQSCARLALMEGVPEERLHPVELGAVLTASALAPLNPIEGGRIAALRMCIELLWPNAKVETVLTPAKDLRLTITNR